MEKYYLLTFNDNYGDEHNVPALECMTENEYNTWLKQPSGEKNPKYEEQLKIYEDNKRKNHEFWELLEKEGCTVTSGKQTFASTAAIPKNRKDLLQLEKEIRELPRVNYPKKIFSNMSAYLGNSGDGFEESYKDKLFMEEFVDDGTVSVLEVNEDFYNTFKKAKLNNLSMCNIFEMCKNLYNDK